MYTYDELKEFVDHCIRCELCKTRNHPVMGKGNLSSPVLFIAEAPGKNEDRDGIPFTGRSGELFDRLLSEIGMSREEIYLTTVSYTHLDVYKRQYLCCGSYAGRAWSNYGCGSYDFRSLK